MRLLPSILCGLAAAQLTTANLNHGQLRNTRRGALSISEGSSSSLPTTSTLSATTASPSITFASITAQNTTTSLAPTSVLDSLPSVTSALGATVSSDNGTNVAPSSEDGLPLQPIVTPAVGIAGVILLITGLVYGVIGIKIRGVYTFFSTAYLAALAVTVLILYVMNPPVSDGIQGAFLVAVLAAGCIFGGLSLIFYEITKGFGCALGGFSLAMWFLTLAPDGLIHSKSMRVVFIVIFMVATSALSIPKYTREHALIGSLPFAGATIAILGIDCFSCAGLKEFWIYLWNLNDNVFPPNAQGYPITRGMRVESAGVILLFLFGLVAQLKLFKLVQKRREEKKQVRQQRQQDSEKMESAIGRQLEADVERDRARWEAVYGNGNKAGVAATVASADSQDDETLMEKRSSSAMDGGIIKPMNDAHTTAKRDSVTQVTVIAIEDDAIEEVSGEQRGSRAQSTFSKGRRSLNRLEASSPVDGTSTAPTTAPTSARHSLQPGMTPAPEVTPLPFRIPTIQRNSRGPAHRDSNGSMYDDEAKRTSSAVKHMRSFTSSIPTSASQEELMMAPLRVVRDDRSSVAATIDDLDEDDFALEESDAAKENKSNEDIRKSMLLPDGMLTENLSTLDAVPDLPSIEEVQTKEPELALGDEKQSVSNVKPDHSESKNGDEDHIKAGQQQDESPESKTSVSADDRDHSQQNDIELSGASTKRDEASRRASMKSSKTTPSAIVQSITDDNLRQLPAPISKVVLSYRTNEWAKHLEVAEQPMVEALAAPPSPGIVVETVLRKDSDLVSPTTSSPKPGYVTGQEAPIPLLLGQSSSSTPSPTTSAQKRLSNTGARGPRFPINPYVPDMTTQSRPVSRQMSVTHSRPGSIAGAPGPIRSFSSSMIPEAISEQPQDLSSRMGTMKTIGSTYAPTLLDQRNNTLSGRMSSVGFNNVQGITASMIQASSRPGTAMSFTAAGVTMNSLQGMAPAPIVNDPALDDLPLTERRALLHARRASGASMASMMGPYPLNRSSTQPTALTTTTTWAAPTASTLNLQEFNSHQPDRNPSINAATRQGNLYNSWRETLNKDLVSGTMLDGRPVLVDEQRRAAMIHEKRWETMRHQQLREANIVRESTFDSMMRRGDMLDLHREAMRKMQANAPKGDL